MKIITLTINLALQDVFCGPDWASEIREELHDFLAANTDAEIIQVEEQNKHIDYPDSTDWDEEEMDNWQKRAALEFPNG